VQALSLPVTTIGPAEEKIAMPPTPSTEMMPATLESGDQPKPASPQEVSPQK